MSDSRIKKLADLLVSYSTKVKKGDWVVVEYQPLAEPLANQVLRAVLEAGGLPSTLVHSERLAESYYKYADKDQLEWISPFDDLYYKEADVMIYLAGAENTRYLTNADNEKLQLAAKAHGALYEIMIARETSGELRWAMTNFPTNAYAQDADMSLEEFQDFVYRATFADQEDPIAAWQQVHDDQQRIIEWLKGKKQVEVKSPNAELSLSIEGRDFINADGTFNMPSGEVYTSPIEDSAQGWVEFTYPAITMGHEVSGVRFEFQDGRIEKATAEKNQDFLLATLDTDEGARYLGEFAIGTNYGIQQFTGSILFDEKIGGSFHVAVGFGFPEIGGKNKSAIHWDFICDIKENSQIQVDGELLYQDGQFVI